MIRTTLMLLVLVLVAAMVPVCAQEKAPQGTSAASKPTTTASPGPGPGLVEPRRGVFRRQFAESDRESELRHIARRMGWTMSFIRKNDPVARHAIKECQYVVYLPQKYDGRRPFGILVWVPVGNEGGFPQEWTEVLDEFNLIGISADLSGNDRLLWYRVAMAIDAVFNLKKSYVIDDERVYVGGYSGGGRVASRVAMHYPGIFHGGIYNGGCNYFKRIPQKGVVKRFWPKRFPRPRGRDSGLTRTRSRHVFVNGQADPNRAQSLGIYRDMRRNERFKTVTWLEMPGLGHVYPDRSWFKKVISAIDTPLQEKRARRARSAAKRDLRRRLLQLGKPEREQAAAEAKKKRMAEKLEKKKKAAAERARKRNSESS